jgi:uncharacterized protein (TIGR01244 family)
MRKVLSLTLAALLVVSSALGAQKLAKQESIKSVPAPTVLETEGLFQARYVKVGDDMFIGGQPTEKALRALKDSGVTTVVNLRMPEELTRLGFDEAKLIESLGMKYVHIPMRSGGNPENAYSPANLKRFADVMKAADGKVLLHCTVAWRASHIWAAYLIQQGVPDEAAVKHARAINLMDEHRMDAGGQPLEQFLGRKVAGLGRP